MLDITVFPITRSPGRIVSQSHQLLKLGLSRVFALHGYNLTPEHWAVLSALVETDGLPQSALADRTVKDRPNITRILDVLERNGYIRRDDDPSDRRKHLIYLTEAGRGAQAALAPLVVNFLRTAFAGWSQEELAAFIELHRRLTHNLEFLRQDPGLV